MVGCRELLQGLSPLLHMLCELATSQLEALHMGLEPQAEAPLPSSHSSHPPGQLPETARAATSSQRHSSAHQSLSQAFPYDSVDLSMLSTSLSTISAAAQGGMQSAWGHQGGCEQEHWAAVEKVQELVAQITKQHAGLFNDALEVACRLALCRGGCVHRLAFHRVVVCRLAVCPGACVHR